MCRHLWYMVRRREQEGYKSALPRDEDPIRGGYNSSAKILGTDACEKAGISSLGITGPTTIYKNQTFEELFQHEVNNNEGKVASAEYGDTFTVDTGKFTGRSPGDKWMVKNIGSESDANIDWGKVNQPTSPEVFDELYEKAVNYFNTKVSETRRDVSFSIFCSHTHDMFPFLILFAMSITGTLV